MTLKMPRCPKCGRPTVKFVYNKPVCVCPPDEVKKIKEEIAKRQGKRKRKNRKSSRR